LAETEKMVWCERWENDFVIDCFMIDEKIPLFFFKKKSTTSTLSGDEICIANIM
jgi:hypothetical protein